MNKTTLLGFASAAALFVGMAAPAHAQDGYMFGTPRVSLTLRLGVAQPADDSDVYRFFRDELTLDPGDFVSAAFGADIGLRVHPQIDALLSVGVSHAATDSEFRDFVETNDEEIRQNTELTRVPVTAGLKFHLLSRGRSLGRYAFVPTKFSPYIGGAAGVMWYNLEQNGDFVDFETLDIFSDHFESNGATFTANAFGGGELWLTPRLGLNVEGRYNWAKADLKHDFSQFGEIDLKGWQLTAGLTLRH